MVSSHITLSCVRDNSCPRKHQPQPTTNITAFRYHITVKYDGYPRESTRVAGRLLVELYILLVEKSHLIIHKQWRNCRREPVSSNHQCSGWGGRISYISKHALFSELTINPVTSSGPKGYMSGCRKSESLSILGCSTFHWPRLKKG